MSTDFEEQLRQVERRLYLRAGFQADVIVILHEPLQLGDGSYAEGVTFQGCVCHPSLPLFDGIEE